MLGDKGKNSIEVKKGNVFIFQILFVDEINRIRSMISTYTSLFHL